MMNDASGCASSTDEVGQMDLIEIEPVLGSSPALRGARVGEGDMIAVLTHDRGREEKDPALCIQVAPRRRKRVGTLPNAHELPASNALGEMVVLVAAADRVAAEQ